MHMMDRHLGRFAALFAGLAMVLSLVIVAGPRVTTAHGLPGPHPVHIHTGTCAELGDVVYPLADVTAGTEMSGATSAVPVKSSTISVEAPLADIVAGGHAINVHESAENIGNYIACGDVGGSMMGTADLAIGLAELNDSYFTGIATLHDNGDGTTTVNVYLTERVDEDEMEHEDEDAEDDDSDDAASPAAGSDAAPPAAGAPVEILDFAFNPASITIAVGESVTWTNNDSAPHTATQDGGGFQTDRIEAGASATVTFDTAGTYTYHCEFHDNMTGTVIVE